jgi:hypothetical protein
MEFPHNRLSWEAMLTLHVSTELKGLPDYLMVPRSIRATVHHHKHDYAKAQQETCAPPQGIGILRGIRGRAELFKRVYHQIESEQIEVG